MLSNEKKRDELNKIIDRLFDKTASNYVQRNLRDLLMSDTDGGKLYKYRSFKNSHSIELLQSQEMFCAQASSFNDPFDCKIGVDFRSLAEAKIGIEFDQIERLLEIFLQHRAGTYTLSDLSDTEQRIFLAWEGSEKLNALLTVATSGVLDTEEKQGKYLLEHFDTIIDLIRPVLTDTELKDSFAYTDSLYSKMLSNLSPSGIMKLSNDQVSISDFAKANRIEDDSDEIGLTLSLSRQQNNHSKEALEKADSTMTHLSQKAAQLLNDSFFIGCLCADYKNRLMWSHYADSHQGFCIEYDFTKASDDSLPLPVIYTDVRPKIPWKAIINNTDQNLMEANRSFMMALLSKDKAWEYEREWRILISSRTGRYAKMPPISCIYLGIQCSEKDRVTVIEMAEKRKIPVRQMVADRGEYDLHSYLLS
jgi:hypothetical protein